MNDKYFKGKRTKLLYKKKKSEQFEIVEKAGEIMIGLKIKQ